MRHRRKRDALKPTRGLLYLLDNELCGICGEHVDWEEATVEHVWPLSRGGSKKLNNTQLAHELCNAVKADRPPREDQLTRLYNRVGWNWQRLEAVATFKS